MNYNNVNDGTTFLDYIDKRARGEESEWIFPNDHDFTETEIEGIYLQLSSMVAVYAFAYMEQLKKRNPIVYNQLRDWAQAHNKMNWYNWEADYKRTE